MKQYKILVKEIEEESIDINHKDSEEINKNYTTSNIIEEDRLFDKALYDLTSITECLSVSMHEYDIERNKKESFDNRAGLIITVLLAIILAIYDKIPLRQVILDMKSPLTFIILIKIVITTLIYAFLIIALYYSIRIISIKAAENFDITVIDNDLIGAAKIDSVSKLLEIYLNLTKTHRMKNENTAMQLARSQKAMIVSVILIIINLNLL